MTEPLAIPIPDATRHGVVGRNTLFSEISKGNLKVHKVGRPKILKYVFAIYFLLGIGVPSTTNIKETLNLKFFASVKKHEFGGFIHQSEVGLGFEFGLGSCATRNQNKMAEEEGFEPSVGY
jgi:hypothetical protein